MPLGEDEVDRGEHGTEPVRQFGRPGNAVRGVVVAELALGPDDPLRHRGLGDDERARDLGGVEPAEQTQREGDLRVRMQRRVAAQEHQAELVVGHDVDECVEVVEFAAQFVIGPPSGGCGSLSMEALWSRSAAT